MNDKIYILFETDHWLTKANATILAVCTSFEEAIKCFDEVSEDFVMSEEKIQAERELLVLTRQTQNFEYNYYIEEYETNCIVF